MCCVLLLDDDDPVCGQPKGRGLESSNCVGAHYTKRGEGWERARARPAGAFGAKATSCYATTKFSHCLWLEMNWKSFPMFSLHFILSESKSHRWACVAAAPYLVCWLFTIYSVVFCCLCLFVCCHQNQHQPNQAPSSHSALDLDSSLNRTGNHCNWKRKRLQQEAWASGL